MINLIDKLNLTKVLIILGLFIDLVFALSLNPRCSTKRDDDFKFELLQSDGGEVVHNFAFTDDALTMQSICTLMEMMSLNTRHTVMIQE